MAFLALIGGTAINGDNHMYTVRTGIDFVMDEVSCIGNEADITRCGYDSNHDCDISKEIAAVDCGNSKLNNLRAFTTNISLILPMIGIKRNCPFS